MKVALLTMFNGLNESYSLVSAVREQLSMLLHHGHQVTVLVSEHCPDEERTGVFANEQVRWVKITNTLHGRRAAWIDYTRRRGEPSEELWELAGVVAQELEWALHGCEVCILHDILYQGLHLAHNIAVRMAQEKLPDVRFLAFTHSQPREYEIAGAPYDFMYSEMPHTVFVCPTEAMRPLLAAQYQLSPEQTAVVPTAVDVAAGMGDETRRLLAVRDFYSPEFVFVYPARAVAAKGHNLFAHFVGAVKRIAGASVLVIFCDAYSDERFRRLVRFQLERSGLLEEEFLFTSELGYPEGVSQQTVLELFTISNVFVFPSLSETQGLVALEAASRGNFLLLHTEATALRELGETLPAALYDFGGPTLRTPVQRGDETIAEIVRKIRGNPVIAAKTAVRRRFSPEAVYRDYLEPLLLGTPPAV